ncbi:hypothetical protein QSH57_005687 [Fusarium oxysporum f. sp. vasinfectum]|nr:hypothetical protein QSH57_005687 [Fusarium oxysporum f. sp. vasinfectum]
MANFYSIKLLQLHVFGQKSKLAFGPWGYTLSLGRYEALHLHFNGQDNEKKEEHNRQACVGTIEDPLRPPSLGGTPGAGGSNGTDTRL